MRIGDLKKEVEERNKNSSLKYKISTCVDCGEPIIVLESNNTPSRCNECRKNKFKEIKRRKIIG